MARPKQRIEGVPRFKIKDRVIWKSGTHWKSGEVLCLGKNKEEALAHLPSGYKLQYSENKQESKQGVSIEKKQMSMTKAPIYLVACDTPLFKPGFTVHSIPERHLQKETESWVWKEEKIFVSNKTQTQLLSLAIEVAKSLHNNKKQVPTNIKEKFAEIFPEIFPN